MDKNYNDIEFVRKEVQQDGYALQYDSDEIRNNPKVVSLARQSIERG